MLERKIGEIFDISISLKVVLNEKNTCEGCHFENLICGGDIHNIRGICSKHERKDGKPVMFVSADDVSRETQPIDRSKETRPVGEIFDYKDVKLKVVERRTCYGCHFTHKCNDNTAKIHGFCAPFWRTDGKSIIFQLVDDVSRETQED